MHSKNCIDEEILSKIMIKHKSLKTLYTILSCILANFNMSFLSQHLLLEQKIIIISSWHLDLKLKYHQLSLIKYLDKF